MPPSLCKLCKFNPVPKGYETCKSCECKQTETYFDLLTFEPTCKWADAGKTCDCLVCVRNRRLVKANHVRD